MLGLSHGGCAGDARGPSELVHHLGATGLTNAQQALRAFRAEMLNKRLDLLLGP